MRGLPILLITVLSGCAASTSGAPAAQGTGERPTGPPTRTLGEQYSEGRITNVQPSVDKVSHDIPAMASQVWAALNQVYDDLEIEVTNRAVGNLTLQSSDFTISRRLGGERLSRYFRCGTGVTGAFADRYRLRINMISTVVSLDPDHSTLETTIQATGTNPAGTSNTRVPCGSTHLLESRIAAEVSAIVTGTPGPTSGMRWTF